MKKIPIILLFLFTINIFAQAQLGVETTVLQNTRIITPCVKNMATMILATHSEFNQIMQTYNYKKIGIESGFDMFDNGVDINNRGTQTISKSTAGTVIRIEWQDSHNTSIIMDLIDELKPYYIRHMPSGSDIYEFTIKGDAFRVVVGRLDQYEAVVAELKAK